MRSKLLANVFMVFMVVALLVGCGGGQTATPPAETPGANPETPAAPKSEWDQLVEKANEEGELILFGPANTIFTEDVIKAFNTQYPNIKVQYRASNLGADVVSKIGGEKRAGVHEVDAIIFGSTTIYNEFIPAGYMAPMAEQLIHDDFKNASLWVNGKLEYSDQEEKYIVPFMQIMGNQLLVNTSLVDPATLTSYEDLLKPELKGKMVFADPRLVGQSRYAFAYFQDLYGESFFEKLAAQEPEVNQDVKQLIEWVAHGKFAIGISPGNADAFQEFIDGGIPIVGMQLAEGGYYSPGYNNISVFKDAPNPNAAKLFANWLFTKDTQEMLSKVLMGSSIRTDVSNPLVLDPNKKYLAPHLQKNEQLGRQGVETFHKYIK